MNRIEARADRSPAEARVAACLPGRGAHQPPTRDGPPRDLRMSVEAERKRLERAWPEAFRDGVRAVFGFFPPDHERGGYFKGFHGSPLEKRNAYFAGFNLGFGDRRRDREKARHG
jgi:hypothetical protein